MCCAADPIDWAQILYNPSRAVYYRLGALRWTRVRRIWQPTQPMCVRSFMRARQLTNSMVLWASNGTIIEQGLAAGTATAQPTQGTHNQGFTWSWPFDSVDVGCCYIFFFSCLLDRITIRAVELERTSACDVGPGSCCCGWPGEIVFVTGGKFNLSQQKQPTHVRSCSNSGSWSLIELG